MRRLNSSWSKIPSLIQPSKSRGPAGKQRSSWAEFKPHFNNKIRGKRMCRKSQDGQKHLREAQKLVGAYFLIPKCIKNICLHYRKVKILIRALSGRA